MNLRMLTAEKPRLIPSRTTCNRCPSGSIASTNGWLMSIRRPLDLSIRSTSSCTCAGVSIRLVSSCRPRRAMKTRLGSLIQISSTAGSSRNGCNAPNPDTRATSSPTTESTSATGATAPVRLRSSCSRTTLSAMRRTTTASRCGSTPSLRTSERTRSSSDSTSSAWASASVIKAPVPSQGFLVLNLRHSAPTREGSDLNLWKSKMQTDAGPTPRRPHVVLPVSCGRIAAPTSAHRTHGWRALWSRTARKGGELALH